MSFSSAFPVFSRVGGWEEFIIKQFHLFLFLRSTRGLAGEGGKTRKRLVLTLTLFLQIQMNGITLYQRILDQIKINLSITCLQRTKRFFI